MLVALNDWYDRAGFTVMSVNKYTRGGGRGFKLIIKTPKPPKIHRPRGDSGGGFTAPRPHVRPPKIVSTVMLGTSVH